MTGEARPQVPTHAYRLHFSVGLQAVLAQLPAAPRHLIAAKWGLGSKHVIAVDPVIGDENAGLCEGLRAFQAPQSHMENGTWRRLGQAT